MTSGTKKDLQPGNYNGIPDVFMLRQVSQYSANRAEAEQYARDAKRTWAIFMGLGDFETNQFDRIYFNVKSILID